MTVTNITKSKNFLTQVIPGLKKKKFSKGSIIFRAGEDAVNLYVILNGQVKIYRTTFDGKERTLNIMQAEDVVGEAPMFEGDTYPADCKALTDVEMIPISRTQILTLIRKDPAIALKMLALQAKKLREFTQKLEQLKGKKIKDRLVDLLNQENLPKNISVQNLANYLGASRENVSRILSKLIKLKLITKQGRIIIVTDHQKLKNYNHS